MLLQYPRPLIVHPALSFFLKREWSGFLSHLLIAMYTQDNTEYSSNIYHFTYLLCVQPSLVCHLCCRQHLHGPRTLLQNKRQNVMKHVYQCDSIYFEVSLNGMVMQLMCRTLTFRRGALSDDRLGPRINHDSSLAGRVCKYCLENCMQ